MAMIAGSVSVDNAGNVSGGDMARAIYDQMIGIFALQTPQVPVPGGAAGVPIKRAQANFANALATAIVGYIQANAKALITVSDAGLQRMPASTAENTDCKAPSGTKELSIA